MTKFIHRPITKFFKGLKKPIKLQTRLTKFYKKTIKKKIYNCVECACNLGKNNYLKYCDECYQYQINRCITCNTPLGIGNPRQLCGHTICLYEDN